jgi:hypothetical protein
MKLGHDGFGLMGEFGPDSMWAYAYDNPEDDAWADEVMGQMEDCDETDEDKADWWKN